MRIDGNFVLAVHHVENDAGSLAAHSGQRFERFTIVGHFAAVAVEDLLGEANEIPGLHVVQANRLQIRLHALDTQFRNRRGRVCHRKQFAGCGVDAFVSRVRRKHYGHEKLKCGVIEQFRGGVRVGSLQPTKDGAATRGIHIVFSLAGALAVCLRAASRAACSSVRRACRTLCAWYRARFMSGVGSRSLPRGSIVIQSTGHGATHNSQPVHIAAITVCVCLREPTMASTGHGGRHLTQPMQRSSSITATSARPSTPLSGLRGNVWRWSKCASAAIVAVPPGGHWFIGAWSLAIASEYGRQPSYPQRVHCV